VSRNSIEGLAKKRVQKGILFPLKVHEGIGEKVLFSLILSIFAKKSLFYLRFLRWFWTL
jgi:hypothetical protein